MARPLGASENLIIYFSFSIVLVFFLPFRDRKHPYSRLLSFFFRLYDNFHKAKMFSRLSILSEKIVDHNDSFGSDIIHEMFSFDDRRAPGITMTAFGPARPRPINQLTIFFVLTVKFFPGPEGFRKKLNQI